MDDAVTIDPAVAGLRREYRQASLSEGDVSPDPIAEFAHWFQQALAARLPEPNAMTLATATRDGVPSARTVLLKGFDEHGFVFYTHYDSPKGRDLAENPRAALVFYWTELERQVRITGLVTRMTQAASEHYFRSRPVGSRLGAWVSRQSQVIAGRAVLEEQLRQLEREYQDKEIPLPPYWGGLRVAPRTIEFWQGRPSRLHDRLRYTRQPDRGWLIERLSP